MIASISLFTILLLQTLQLLGLVLFLYFIFWLISYPLKYFWGSITYKTKL